MILHLLLRPWLGVTGKVKLFELEDRTRDRQTDGRTGTTRNAAYHRTAACQYQ